MEENDGETGLSGLPQRRQYAGCLFYATDLENLITQHHCNDGYFVGDSGDWLTVSSDAIKVLDEAVSQYGRDFVILGIESERLKVQPERLDETMDEPGRVRDYWICNGKYRLPFLNPEAWLPMSPMTGPVSLVCAYNDMDSVRKGNVSAEELLQWCRKRAERGLYVEMRKFDMLRSKQDDSVDHFRQDSIDALVSKYFERQ